MTMAALLIGYAVAIAIVFFASRPISINRPRIQLKGGRKISNTYLQGRKITAAHDHERPSVETLHLIRKLRWIGMEEEAERVETQLHEATLAGGVITAAHETD
jgi:hypothetical protein